MKLHLLLLSISLAGSADGNQMVVFGDSLSDTGYWLGLRLIDDGGELWHETLADRLGYSRATTGGFLGSSGLNLAVGGALISGLQSQVNRYSTRYTWQTGDLCTLWIGGNDLLDDATQNMTPLTDEIGDIITQLAGLGIDHFIIPNLPDLGAVPDSQGNNTLIAQRQAGTIAFNAALDAELDNLESSLSIQIDRLKIFSLFDHMLLNYADFGYTYTTDRLDNHPTGLPKDYVFWDNIHPTSYSHELISATAVALVDSNAPIEVISWAINPDGTLRQTWLAAPNATYSILSAAEIDQLAVTHTFDGKPAYTAIIPAPSASSGFFQTQKN